VIFTILLADKKDAVKNTLNARRLKAQFLVKSELRDAVITSHGTCYVQTKKK